MRDIRDNQWKLTYELKPLEMQEFGRDTVVVHYAADYLYDYGDGTASGPCSNGTGHTVGDTRSGMKVAISLPDPLFRAAERLARKLRKSRSQFYAEAIAEYVGALGAGAVTARLNAVYGKESSEVEPALKYAQLKRLNREAW